MKKLENFSNYVLPWWGVSLIVTFTITFFVKGLLWNTLLTESWHWGIILIILLISFASIAQKFMLEVKVNTCQVVQNELTGELHPEWPGLSWLSRFDKVLPEFLKDTQKHQKTETSGDCSAINDKMNWKAKIFWIVDIIHNRDENMKKYVNTTTANIDNNIELFVSSLVTDYCVGRTADNIKATRADILSVDSFNTTDQGRRIIREYGIRIIDCGVEDIDYSDAVEKARAALRESDALIDVMKNIKTKAENAGIKISDEEIARMARSQMPRGNYKQVDVTGNNTSNVKPLIQV